MIWLAALIVGIGATTGLLSLWLVLRFLRHTYDKGGVDDLTAAASAIHIARWPRRARQELPEPGNDERADDTPRA